MKKKLHLLLYITVLSYCSTSYTQNFDLEVYCAKIQSIKDKINGSIAHKSPLTNPIVFSRYPKKDSHFYMIELKKVTKYKSSGYGITIEFDNGQKIERNHKVAIRINDNTQFEHFTRFKLEPNEIELFKKHLVKEFTLHRLTFSVENPKKYRAYIQCIEKM